MSLDEVAKSRLGRVLRGKYRLDRVLGFGGMAAVYAATHRNRRQFAVKMLHPELSAIESIRTRFQREGYVANSVNHRGAVAVLDDDVAEDGSAFLVMELLDGATVEELWEERGHALQVSVVLALADQLLDVLAAAHANGIVHRDLKPANLFLTREGVLKVLDFGIARLLEEGGGGTQTGQVMGTPAFMAPEQAFGRARELDAQADVWAVGATLFTLLSGRHVHEGDTPQQVLLQLGTQPARSLGQVAPDVPASIARVVDRALAFEKRDRWASAAAMREELARAQVEAFGSATGKEVAQNTLSALLEIPSGPAAARGKQAAPVAAAAPVRRAYWYALALFLVGSGSAIAFVYLRQAGVSPTKDPLVRVDEENVRPAAAVEASVLAEQNAGDGIRKERDAAAKGSPPPSSFGGPRGEAKAIDPRAPSAFQPQPPAHTPPAAPSPLCIRLLERLSLGDPLSAEEKERFARECRN